MRLPNSTVRASERGVAVVEAALTLLTFLVFLFALMEGARFLSVQQVISNAAREGARHAVLPLAGTSALPTAAEVQARVVTFLDAAAIVGANVEVNPVSNAGGAYTLVRVSIQYQPLTLSMFNNLSVTLTGESLMRNETSP